MDNETATRIFDRCVEEKILPKLFREENKQEILDILTGNAPEIQERAVSFDEIKKVATEAAVQWTSHVNEASRAQGIIEALEYLNKPSVRILDWLEGELRISHEKAQEYFEKYSKAGTVSESDHKSSVVEDKDIFFRQAEAILLPKKAKDLIFNRIVRDRDLFMDLLEELTGKYLRSKLEEEFGTSQLTGSDYGLLALTKNTRWGVQNSYAVMVKKRYIILIDEVDSFKLEDILDKYIKYEFVILSELFENKTITLDDISEMKFILFVFNGDLSESEEIYMTPETSMFNTTLIVVQNTEDFPKHTITHDFLRLCQIHNAKVNKLLKEGEHMTKEVAQEIFDECVENQILPRIFREENREEIVKMLSLNLSGSEKYFTYNEVLDMNDKTENWASRKVESKKLLK